MNVQVFAEWLRRQGSHVIETSSSFWHRQAPGVYQAFPYHWCVEPPEQELRALLVRNNVAGVRYSAPLHATEGRLSYHVVYEGAYNLDSVGANARSKIRRGLKRCSIERISVERLAAEGWRLQADTLERQGRAGQLSQARWERICLAARGLAGFEAWAAIVDGRVAASILTARVGDACYMLYPQSHHEYFGRYVNNALAYAISADMLSRPGVRMIFYGLHSLDAPPTVDEFKLGMGYAVKAVRQRVVFHPWLAPIFTGLTHSLVKRLLARRRGHRFLPKVEGMIRFYLEGKRPLDAQEPPPFLSGRAGEEPDPAEGTAAVASGVAGGA